MATVQLQFIGTRRQHFTVDSPTGIQDAEQRIIRHYVDPEQPVEVDAADAEALLKRDPHLWAHYVPPVAETVAAETPAEGEASEPDAATEGEFNLTRSRKNRDR